MMKKIAFYLMAAVLLVTACNDELETGSPVTGVTISESAVMLKLGEKVIVSAIVDPAGASDILWTSCDETIATVDRFGGITAIAKGTTSVIATTIIGRKVASCAVYVDAIRTERIELDIPALYLLPEESASLTATVFPANATNKTVKWISSDEKVATVEFINEKETGKVQVLATGFGNATITAMTEDGEFKAFCLVTVSKISVTGILISQSAFEGVNGETLQLYATILPDNATFPEVIWTSSDESMATVDETGLVTIVSKEEGSAVITATSKDNNMFSATCNITVLKDMSSLVVKTIWEGNVELTWGSDGQVGIPYSHFEGVPVGAILTFHFKQKDAWGQAQINNGKWAAITGLGINGYLKTGEVGDKSVTSFESVLTQQVLDNIHANHGVFAGVDCGLIFQGSDWILTKLTITSSVVVNLTVLWEGNVGPIDWSGSHYMPLNVDLLSPGQTMGIDFECASSAAHWQIEVMGGSWWEALPAWLALNDGNRYIKELEQDETNLEIPNISQADIDCIRKQGSAMLCCGNGVILKRLYVK